MRLRLTNQREMILEELRSSNRHLSADELYEKVRRLVPRISLATIYRNLETLAELGIVAKLETGGRQKRFDYDVSGHDHIYCIICHRVDNITLQRERVPAIAPEQQGEYTVTGYRLEFAGICPKCQKKKKEKKA